jgi:7-keto-8-aminopelargonate synthetase-like enzyme
LRLERALATWKGTEAALCFSSGYSAALGTIPALVTKSDVILLDKLCHASLIDGAKLSGGVLRVFPHNHVDKLESHLEWARR